MLKLLKKSIVFYIFLMATVFGGQASALDSQLVPQPISDPSLQDLGFSAADTTPDLKLQKDLDSRNNKLKAHQISGLATLALMTAAVVVSDEVKHNDIHEVLGSTAAGAYWTTFYLSETAPRPQGLVDRGLNIKIHKAMVWIHAPLMVLTPIVGLIAQNQIYSGYQHPPAGDLKDVLGLATFLSYAIGTSVMFIEF